MRKEDIQMIKKCIEQIEANLKNIFTNENVDIEAYDEAVQISYNLEELKDVIKEKTESV